MPDATATVLPRAATLRFDDPDHYGTVYGLGGAIVHARRYERFSANVTGLDLGHVRVRRGEATASVTLAGAAPRNYSFTFATRPAEARILSGRAVPFGTLFVPRPDDHLFATSPSRQPWPWAALGIDHDVLDNAAAALAGRTVTPSRIDTSLIVAPAAPRQRLLGLVADAGRLAESHPDIAEAPAAARALSDAIIEAVVACLAGGEIAPDRAATRRHHRIMARLAQVLEEQAGELLTVAEICAAVGVAQSSLNAVCQAFTGSSVMEYARGHRLALARDALLRADGRHIRVAGVATQFGFWELGRFAAAYRARFGELPSQTLRKTLA